MSTDTAAARTAVSPFLRKANAVVGIGDVRGWPRPQPYTDALAMLNAAKHAARDLPAFPPLPTKPGAVQKWVDTVAEIRQREATRRDVADELLLVWERHVADAGLAVVGDYTERLIDAFDELVDAFDELADAPRTLGGLESSEQLEAHASLLRTAAALYNAVVHRATLGDAAGEDADIGGDITWLILDPQPNTTRNAIEAALLTYRGKFPQSVEDWDELRPLGLRLAHIGEVKARKNRHATFKETVAMTTVDGGVLDHRYAEVDGPRQPVAHQRLSGDEFAFEPAATDGW